MSPNPISVKREEGYILVNFPSPVGIKSFENIGNVTIALRMYHRDHANDFPKPLFEIESELYGGPGGEGALLESNVGDLYKFRKHG